MGFNYMSLSIEFFCNDLPVKNLLVFVRLSAKTKNDYPLEPQITNNDGLVYISTKEIKETIEKHLKEFPMDYNCKIENCNGLEIEICTLNQINEKVRGTKDLYPDSSEKMKQLSSICCNKTIKSKKEKFVFPLKDKLRINLENC